MNVVFSNKIDAILSIGIYLGPFYINNWALNKSQALNALEKLKVMNVPVLGGDVLEYKGDILKYENEGFVHNYDNWYCDTLPKETLDNYVNRSIQEARGYIFNYVVCSSVYFVLVPDEIQNMNNVI